MTREELLKSIREPTQAMIDRALREVDYQLDSYDLVMAYKAMIDELLMPKDA